MELKNEYLPDEPATVNCTATMNPNTTKVFLVQNNTNSQLMIIPTNNEKNFVEPANEDVCNPKVRVVYQVAFSYWKNIISCACMVEDKDYGRNFTSEFKTPTIIIIN